MQVRCEAVSQSRSLGQSQPPRLAHCPALLMTTQAPAGRDAALRLCNHLQTPGQAHQGRLMVLVVVLVIAVQHRGQRLLVGGVAGCGARHSAFKWRGVHGECEDMGGVCTQEERERCSTKCLGSRCKQVVLTIQSHARQTEVSAVLTSEPMLLTEAATTITTMPTSQGRTSTSCSLHPHLQPTRPCSIRWLLLTLSPLLLLPLPALWHCASRKVRARFWHAPSWMHCRCWLGGGLAAAHGQG